jgi:hypothetical protein
MFPYCSRQSQSQLSAEFLAMTRRAVCHVAAIHDCVKAANCPLDKNGHIADSTYGRAIVLQLPSLVIARIN